MAFTDALFEGCATRMTIPAKLDISRMSAAPSTIVRPMPSPETPAISATGRPTLDVAVVMRRERLHGPSSHWQPWRWTLDSVVPDEPGFGTEPRLLHDDEGEQRWLHPGFQVE